MNLLVESVTTFLHCEIRALTSHIIECQNVSQRLQNLAADGIDVQLESSERRLLAPGTAQRLVDRCEQHLVREAPNAPVQDPVFQNVAWVCAVAHDLLPELIRDARDFQDIDRVKRLESVYLSIHDCITRLLKPGK
ncbi:MAG: hypothetical protein JNK76_24475 [Planctomycetales bacterium]|nr:hypothetical protein [Planctomycetales bacterium]MBN8626655.1 hypothetical protein [Planctomycetota bacterium]